MTKVVKLSVHKNNKLQKDRKALRHRAIQDIKDCMKPSDVAGYCIVSWNKNRDANICWDIQENSLEPRELPSFVESIVSLRVTQKRMEE